ncbi:uncharacterized protein CCOS01_15759 [Colletotrichum costaricense]|uniref:C2H2-type domain-containing protein n=1 Tax=Colletotrichum costaricense TaxID=1209916 RepID=A0AAI9YGZ4_9PEZI|nr:uncharacterized protein CCOS01_15759 [Colletotrichum costaricense]KAK1509243.1 hypothetical protein CCOS01_15759 [Colletotrichum costaricense]
MDQQYHEEERKRLEYYQAERARMAGAYQYVPPEEAYPAEALADHNEIEGHRLHDNYHEAAQGAHENPLYVEHLGQNAVLPQQANNAVERPFSQQGQNDAIQAEHYAPIDPELQSQAIIAVQPAGNALSEPHVAPAGDFPHPNFNNLLPDYIYDFQTGAANIQPGHAGQIDNLLQDGFNIPYPDLGPIPAPFPDFGDPEMFLREHEQWQYYNNQGFEQYGQQMVGMQAQEMPYQDVQLQYREEQHNEGREYQEMPYQQHAQDNEYHIHGQGHHDQVLHQQHDHHVHQNHAFDQPQQEQHHHGHNEDAPLQQDDAQDAAAAPSPLAQDNNPQPAADVQAPRARNGRRSHTRTIAGSQFNDGTPDPNPEHYGLAGVSPRPPCRELPRIVNGVQKVAIACNRCTKILSRKDEMRWHLRRDHYGEYYPEKGFHIEKGRQQALLDCPK